MQWIIALKTNTCKYVQIFKRITPNVYWKSVYILIVKIPCNKKKDICSRQNTRVILYMILSYLSILMTLYKKEKYRVTNKLLLNLIYMYAHFIELIISPDYVFENWMLCFATLLYNQGYAIVTRRTSSCSFVLSLSPMSFILFINSPYFFFSLPPIPILSFLRFVIFSLVATNWRIKQ